LNIYYGWWIVAAAFIISVYLGGTIIYGFTAFIQHIEADTGWSRAQISLAVSLRGIEAGVLAALSGVLADKFGSRKLVFIGSLLTGLSLVLVSRADSLSSFYLAYAILAFGISSCGLTVMMSTLAEWFQFNLGKATGILISGFGLSGTLVPAITALINQYGWRTTFFIMGIGAFIIIAPLSLVFRRRPNQSENTGSETKPEPENSPLIAAAETGLGIGQLLRNTTFWKIAIIFTLHRIMVSTVITHIMPYLEGTTILMSDQRASLVAMALTLTSIFGRLGFGWLADKYNKKLVASAAIILMLLGLLFLANISSS
jgi:sugar phosphate permease